MGLTRRNFLQQASWSLLALGADLDPTTVPSETSAASKVYRQALSQPGGRKLALLVGIDRYPFSTNLAGCRTDVELQRELLIGRFGFQPADILTLSDAEATREDIETAFVEHLIEQAKEGDTVVFHFSGYGNTVKIPATTAEQSEGLVKSLLPADGVLTTKGKPANNELLWETLGLLARSLATQRVTLVLDTSYSQMAPRLQGLVRSRSPRIERAECPCPQEIAFQTQLKSDFKGFKKRRSLPPVTLLAAAENQAALEAQWDGFSAGLFTYALVQTLWEMTPPRTVYAVLGRSSDRLRRLAEQEPQIIAPETAKKLPQVPYFTPPLHPLGAEGTAIAIADKNTTVRLHLAGLPPHVLAYYQPNSRLQLDLPGSSPVLLQVRSRDGLKVTAKVVGEGWPEGFTWKPGLTVREQLRVLPRDLGLTVALAEDLERIERVDATSAFSNSPGVSSVVVAGEQMADCLFGQGHRNAIAPSPESDGKVASNNSQGYALFRPGGAALPHTLGSPGEAIAAAVDRLKPKLPALLAEKLWRLTLNEASSQLPVRVRLMAVEPAETLLERRTARSRQAPSALETAKAAQPAPLELPAGTRIQYVLENFGDRPLYAMLFSIDANRDAIALYPTKSKNSAQLQPVLLQPGSSLTLPENSATWTIAEAPGLTQVYAIVSLSPFTETFKALAAIPDAPTAGEHLRKLPEPVPIARALLKDLHAASAVPVDVLGTPADVWALDVRAWAAFEIVYRAIPAK